MPENKAPSNLSLGTLLPACLASVAATFLLARVGLAGTLLGAALIPLIWAVVKDLARPPVERLAEAGRLRPHRSHAESSQADLTRRREISWASRLSFLSWRRVVLTGAAAFAITIAVFTIPELILGESVTDDRRTTFFTPTQSKTSDQDERVPPEPAPMETGEEGETPTETEAPGETDAPAETEAPAEPGQEPASPEVEESPQQSQEPPAP